MYVGADIIRPFKKRRFAREHLIRQNLRFCHLPLKGKAEWLNLTGWDYNPSVCFADTSLCTREAISPPYIKSAETGTITVGADIIRPFF